MKTKCNKCGKIQREKAEGSVCPKENCDGKLIQEDYEWINA